MDAISRFAAIMAERQQLLTGIRYANTALLNQVRAPAPWGVFASIGPNFRHAVFGRDSIELAEDIYKHDQTLAHDIIVIIARLQGTNFNEYTEEEPGKIHHEYRTTHFADEPIPENSLGIMRKLQEKWGDPAHDRLLYYGAYDATPLYIRLVQEYTDEYGNGILRETYVNKDGATQTILDSLRLATEWLVGKLRLREDRLLAYRRSNPRGIENQVWKDSVTAYMFSDGKLPDHNREIVSAELQGYTYDALIYAARVFPDKASDYQQLANQVQHSTIEKLWMPQWQYFAQGLGIHPSGEERQIDTLTSNGALLLDSKLIEDLPEWARTMYVDGIEKHIASPDFLTPAGVRCRALRHANLLPYTDYHGSHAVWAKETSDIARGLTRFGRTSLAGALHKSILRSFRMSREFYELFYVDTDGTVYYDQARAIARFSSDTMGEPLPVPEPGQAWSISAAILSSHALSQTLAKKFPVQHTIQQALATPIPIPPLKRPPALGQLFVSAQASLRRRTRRNK